MERRRNKKKQTHAKDIIERNNIISINTKVTLKNNFILLANDLGTYPKEDDIIAVYSDTFYDDYNMDDIEHRYVFESETATQEIGIEKPRYFMVVDRVIDSKVYAYDTNGDMHVFGDDVMVVDLYLYPALSCEKTFTKYDLTKEPMAVLVKETLPYDSLLDLLDTAKYPLYERVLMSAPKSVKDICASIYEERGLILADGLKVVKVRLEYGVFASNDFKGDMIPYCVEVLEALQEKGYHIDIFTETNTFDTSLKNILVNRNIPYNSIGSHHTKYDYLVDTRCAMSYNQIDWTVVYENITNEKFNTDFDDALYLTKEHYFRLLNEGVLLSLYPNICTWEQLEQIQDQRREGVPFNQMDETHQDIIESMKLKKYFL